MMERRTRRQIIEDMRAYLSMAALFEKVGDKKHAREYEEHARAMERELELLRHGRVLSLI
jgi:Tfp pilus assembly protein PilF